MCTIQRHAIQFWNYVIPDGSTTLSRYAPHWLQFWNYVIPDGSTTRWWLPLLPPVLELCHSRWFYYCKSSLCTVDIVLELCHSRWFYYCQSMQRLPNPVLELCHSRWFYYYQADGIPASVVLEPCHSRWFYYYMTRQLQRLRSWEIRAARRRRLRA